MRIATAAVLAAALAALPAVLDGCAASCEMHRAAADTAPSCHHATAPAPRVGQVPGSCGHDHTSTVVTAASRPALPTRAFDAAIAPSVVPIAGSAVALNHSPAAHAPPDLSPPSGPGSLPLRI